MSLSVTFLDCLIVLIIVVDCLATAVIYYALPT